MSILIAILPQHHHNHFLSESIVVYVKKSFVVAYLTIAVKMSTTVLSHD